MALPLLALLPLLSPLFGAAGSVRFIQEGQRGMKLRFGKVMRGSDGRPKIYHPGFTLTVPTIHKLHRLHVKAETLTLPTQTIMLADRTVFEVAAFAITRIRDSADDLYQALFEVEDVDRSVTEYVASVLRETVAAMNHHELDDPAEMADRVRVAVAPQLAQWGVSIEQLKLTDCSPSTETARLILIESEVEARVEGLVAAAPKCIGMDVSPILAAALVGAPAVAAVGHDRGRDEDGHGGAELAEAVRGLQSAVRTLRSMAR